MQLTLVGLGLDKRARGTTQTRERGEGTLRSQVRSRNEELQPMGKRWWRCSSQRCKRKSDKYVCQNYGLSFQDWCFLALVRTLFRYAIPCFVTLVALYWQIDVLVSSRCTLGIFKWVIILISVESFEEYSLNKMGNTGYVNYMWRHNAMVKGEGGKQAVRNICNTNVLRSVVKTFI